MFNERILCSDEGCRKLVEYECNSEGCAMMLCSACAKDADGDRMFCGDCGRFECESHADHEMWIRCACSDYTADLCPSCCTYCENCSKMVCRGCSVGHDCDS